MKECNEEQLLVQLAGCSAVALGATRNPAKKGDYGWSPAYQDVLELRRAFDATERFLVLKELRGAVARGWTHPKNSHKELDSDLAEAIISELIRLRTKG